MMANSSPNLLRRLKYGTDPDLTFLIQKAEENFRDHHGHDPHPAMNTFALIRNYSTPWRKSPIPVVRRKHQQRKEIER